MLRPLYQKLFDNPNIKAKYTNTKIYSVDVVTGTLSDYQVIKLDIYRLGNRLFTLLNGHIVSGPQYDPNDLRLETGTAINLYYGPTNEELCALLGLSRRSAVELEELVTNCKNTKLKFFSVFLRQGNLVYIRHNSHIQVDNDEIGRFIACVDLARAPSEPLVRIALAKSIEAVKLSS